jgi:hypothetical protein
VTGEIIAIERGERKMPGAMLGHILRCGDGKEFEIAAVKLNKRIAGAERMLAAWGDGKS